MAAGQFRRWLDMRTMRTLLRSLLALLVATVSAAGVGASRPREHTGVGVAVPCVPSERFSISGVTHGDSPETVLRVLGPPQEKTPDADMHAETWAYADIDVQIVAGETAHVFYVSTASPKHETPAGIRPGMRRAEALRRLGAAPGDQDPNTQAVQVIACDADAYLVLKFDSAGVLRRLELGSDLP